VARNALALEEHGDIQISRQKFEDGKWRAVPPGGDRIRARTKFCKHDGTYTELSAYGKTRRLARPLSSARSRSRADAE
jgi:hypothetical protein